MVLAKVNSFQAFGVVRFAAEHREEAAINKITEVGV